MTKKWCKEQIIYQIYPRSFFDSNGDIKGILLKLDFLEYLGIDIIWISHHFDSLNFVFNLHKIKNIFNIIHISSRLNLILGLFLLFSLIIIHIIFH